MTRRSLIAPSAIIFDFDLTLADSRPGFVAGHNHAAAALGMQAPSPYAVERAIGTPLERVVPGMFPAFTPDEIVEYIRLYRVRADEVMTSSTTMLPGAVECVHALQGADIKLAIVSQKQRHLVDEVLQREALRFDVVLGAQDVPAFKPDPSGLLLALDRLRVEVDDAIYVGDTVIDAEAAANAGLRFVGVLTGPTTREELQPFDNVGLLDSVAELPGFLGV